MNWIWIVICDRDVDLNSTFCITILKNLNLNDLWIFKVVQTLFCGPSQFSKISIISFGQIHHQRLRVEFILF